MAVAAKVVAAIAARVVVVAVGARALVSRVVTGPAGQDNHLAVGAATHHRATRAVK
jgi:hypothetical protein